MATLQKFKLFANQCGVAQSPTESPRASPVVHLLRRKKTSLRMLLTRSSASGRQSPRRQEASPIRHHQSIHAPVPEKKRDTLKDLFVSSPPLEEEENKGKVGEMIGGRCEVYRMRVNGLGTEPAGSSTPGWIGFRHRSLIRRVWRPMLITIPEDDDQN